MGRVVVAPQGVGVHCKKTFDVPTPGMGVLVTAHTPGNEALVAERPNKSKMVGEAVQLTEQSVIAHSETVSDPPALQERRMENCCPETEMVEQ